MTDIIIHKHSITAGDAPEPAELSLGELAIQAADGHIYLKKTDGTVNRVTMLPGGTQQQVLYKTNAGDYALGWGTITSTLMGGALWSEVVAEVQRVFELVEGTASVLLSAQATLTAGSTGPITVSVADSSYLTDGTSITGVLGTVYGTLNRSGSTYSFVSNQSYTNNVTFLEGTRFAAAFLNDTFNPLRVGDAELHDDLSYSDTGYVYAIVDASGRSAWSVKADGSIVITGGDLRLGDAELQEDLSYADAGYAYVIVDANNQPAFAITNEGKPVFFGSIDEIRVNKLIAPGGTIDLDSADTQLLNILEGGAQTGDASYADVYSHAIVDSSDRLAFGIKADGSIDINGEVNLKAGEYDFFAHVELDSNGKISRAVRSTGENYFPKADFDELTIKGQPIDANLIDVRARVSGDSAKGIDYDQTTGVFSSPDGHANRVIVLWGDSLSHDISKPEIVAQLGPGREAISRAIGGTPNDCILGRMNALPISGRVYYEVKNVTVVSVTGAVVTLASGNGADIEVGDFFVGPDQHKDTTVIAVNGDEVTLCIDAGSLSTAADAYAIQRPKIEGGKVVKFDDVYPNIFVSATLILFSYFYIKGLRGSYWPQGSVPPQSFTREATDADYQLSIGNDVYDWSEQINERTSDGYISTAFNVVADVSVTSGGASAGETSITVSDTSYIEPGHFVLAKGVPQGCRVWSVDYSTNEVKLAMATTGAVVGNVRIYERVSFTVDTARTDIEASPSYEYTTMPSGISTNHCINVFDFDGSPITETSRPHWWPNAYHGIEPGKTGETLTYKNVDVFQKAEFLAQLRSFVEKQKNPYGKFLITSYASGAHVYESQGGNWLEGRVRASWQQEAYPENFYDFFRDFYLKSEAYFQEFQPDYYNHAWQKTFVLMGTGALPDPTLSVYPGTTDPLMDGDLWQDESDTLYILLQTTGNAAHDTAQENTFGGSYTLPTTAGHGIWIPANSSSNPDSFVSLAIPGQVSISAGIGQDPSGNPLPRFGVIDGVTYIGSAYDIKGKTMPRMANADNVHANRNGSKFKGYLIGQELLRRDW